MKKTVFDLSADRLTLDYDALTNVARIGVAYAMRDLERRMNQWHEIGSTPTALDAEWMSNAATALAEATQALSYLEGGKDRDYIAVAVKVEEIAPKKGYNKIELIKMLRTMLAQYPPRGAAGGSDPGLSAAKGIVEAIIEEWREM